MRGNGPVHASVPTRNRARPEAMPQHRLTALVASLNPAEDRRIYNTLVMLAHVVNIVEPENHWGHRLRALIHAQTFPVTERMGFPDDWETRPIWQKKN